MQCPDAQSRILDSLEETLPAEIMREVQSHRVDCADCARFAAGQGNVDRRLGAHLIAPEMSPAFRAGLRQKIRSDAWQVWSTALPDAVHFVTCGVATVSCAWLLPFEISVTVSAGAAATATTYLLTSVVRELFDRSDEWS
jgi:hypothetical protein